jgi:hypothetical protein
MTVSVYDFVSDESHSFYFIGIFSQQAKIMKYISTQFPYTTTSNTETNKNFTYEYTYKCHNYFITYQKQPGIRLLCT